MSKTSEGKFQVPILLLTFNRSDYVLRQLDSLRVLQPKILFVSNDGPRQNNRTDKVETKKIRDIIQKQINWDCKVKTRFPLDNEGCRVCVSSAITWFFSQNDEGIVLEDDCFPDNSFYFYCEELLEKYRKNDRVMHISGLNILGDSGHKESYAFSKHPLCWGWASWARAWKKYSVEMSGWEKESNQLRIKDYVGQRSFQHWKEIFDRTYAGKIDTWDYQWIFACWLNQGFSIIPRINLVENIGFDARASHTKFLSPFEGLKRHSMKFPLKHPPTVVLDVDLDMSMDKLFRRKKMHGIAENLFRKFFI